MSDKDLLNSSLIKTIYIFILVYVMLMLAKQGYLFGQWLKIQ
jgi:hypothetical protein